MRSAELVAISGLVLIGCSSSTATYEMPRQPPERVLAVARQSMEARGTAIEQYELDRLSFDYVDREWSLFFSGKSLAVGDHFVVIISDSDLNAIEVVPGL